MKLKLFAGVLLMMLLPVVAAVAHPFDQTYQSAVDALDTYRALIKDYPEDLELHYLLGDMLIMANELDEAATKFQYVLKKNPDYDMARYKLAEILYRKEKYEEVLKPLSEIKDPALEDDRLIAEATCYLRLKKFKKALEVSELAIKADALNPGGWLHKGLAQNELGKPDEAISLIIKSLKMDPEQPLVYDWFRDIVRENLKPEKQVDVLKELYDAIPYDTPTAQQILKDIYHIKNRSAK